MRTRVPSPPARLSQPTAKLRERKSIDCSDPDVRAAASRSVFTPSKRRPQTLRHEWQRVNCSRDDCGSYCERQTNSQRAIEKASDRRTRAEQHQQVITQNCRRQNERQGHQCIDKVSSREISCGPTARRAPTCDQCDQRSRAATANESLMGNQSII